MNKKCILIIGLIMVFLLCGCGSIEKIENDSSTAVIDVDKNMFDVTITIPADIVGKDKTQEDFDSLAREKGYKSITLNEDGSATYVMTKSQHSELMQTTKQNIEEGLTKIINDTENNIVDINTNNDYTDIKVYLSKDKLSLYDGINNLAFILYGGMYNAFNGTPVNNIHIQYIHNETGDIISEVNSSELGK